MERRFIQSTVDGKGHIMNVAILGTGTIARAMATALNGIREEVTAYAVASRSLEKAQAFADTWGFEKAYGSYEELAKDPAIDLIYIATPHSEHFSNTKLCLENGRNCIVEKAFCANRKQTQILIDLAKSKDLLLAEAMWTRYLPSTAMIQNLLAEGRIGEPKYLESDFSVNAEQVERMWNPSLCGGALLDLGIYSLTSCALFFGTDIVKIHSDVKMYSTGVDVTNETTFTYRDGKVAKAISSFSGRECNACRIEGTNGSLVFGPINNPEYLRAYDLNGNLTEEFVIPPQVNGYEYEILACKCAMNHGKKECRSLPHSEMLRMMGWMDSLRNHWGMVYPFEEATDIALTDEDVWGVKDIFDDAK